MITYAVFLVSYYALFLNSLFEMAWLCFALLCFVIIRSMNIPITCEHKIEDEQGSQSEASHISK